MARHPIPPERQVPPPERPPEAGMSVAEWAATAPERHSRPLRPTRPSERDRYASEVVNFMKAKQWGGCRPGHLVALYAYCHGAVYRVAPSELEVSKTFTLAMIAAKQFVDREFRGDCEEAVRFIQWTWQREREREDFRVARGTGGGSIGWRLQFSANLATQYRIDAARQKARGC